MWLYFIPLYVVGALLLFLGVLVLLGRVKGGKYLRPIVAFLMKAPLLGKLIQRGSRAALERQNPELAGAIRKLERVGASRDPARAQAALSTMTADERRAWLEAAGQQGGVQPTNRAERRRLERMQKGQRRSR